jgi:hypothetical protein
MLVQAQIPWEACLPALQATIGRLKRIPAHAQNSRCRKEPQFRTFDMHIMTARAGFVIPQACTCLRCHKPHPSYERSLSNTYFYCELAESPPIDCYKHVSKQILPFKVGTLPFSLDVNTAGASWPVFREYSTGRPGLDRMRWVHRRALVALLTAGHGRCAAELVCGNRNADAAHPGGRSSAGAGVREYQGE